MIVVNTGVKLRVSRVLLVSLYITIESLVCSYISSPVFAQTAKVLNLTLETAINRAEANNPQLLATQRSIDVAKTGVAVAGVRPNPRLSIDIPFGQAETKRTIGIEQLIELGGKRGARLALADSIVVTTKGAGKPIFLQDLAQVSQGSADRTQIVSDKGKPGLTLNIFRQPSSNVVTVAEAIDKEITSLEKSLPPGVKISKAYDESGLVVDAIANVRDSIAIGIVLIIIVLYFFLREWRSTVIASITIPLSALAAFSVLYFVGQSLNLMSLGGLAVAIGLVIDDAIVVIENIDRQLQNCRN